MKFISRRKKSYKNYQFYSKSLYIYGKWAITCVYHYSSVEGFSEFCSNVSSILRSIIHNTSPTFRSNHANATSNTGRIFPCQHGLFIPRIRLTEYIYIYIYIMLCNMDPRQLILYPVSHNIAPPRFIVSSILFRKSLQNGDHHGGYTSPTDTFYKTRTASVV
jgi:hypothetical protein